MVREEYPTRRKEINYPQEREQSTGRQGDRGREIVQKREEDSRRRVSNETEGDEPSTRERAEYG